MILKIWSSSHWLSCSWSPMSLLITHDLFLMPSINDSRDLVHWDNQREEDIIVIMRQYLMTIAKTSSSLFCRDLALAGEFGRELLQTNDELRTAIERHRQESARRIEVQTILGLVWVLSLGLLLIYWVWLSENDSLLMFQKTGTWTRETLASSTTGGPWRLLAGGQDHDFFSAW